MHASCTLYGLEIGCDLERQVLEIEIKLVDYIYKGTQSLKHKRVPTSMAI